MFGMCVNGGFEIDFGLDYELTRERLNADAGRRFREYMAAKNAGADDEVLLQARRAYIESAALLRK